MKKTACILAIMTAAFASVAQAQEAPVERDPFHPEDAGFVSSAPVPGDKAWGRDPFSNPFTGNVPAQKQTEKNSVREAPSMMLTGIIYSPEVRLAIVGGEMFAEGSRVGDKKIVQIRSRSVVFQNAAGGKEEVFLDNFSAGR